ncbi:MAG: UDP-2,3-diacylglucosamine diphosphatase [Candidatus Omnitrophota bacterium]
MDCQESCSDKNLSLDSSLSSRSKEAAMASVHRGRSVFFADLHHPGGQCEEIDALFGEIPDDAKRIFLLGDIFHYWINDKEFIEERYRAFLSRLKRWADQGIELFFLEGNRDFLASHYFDEQSWIEVLSNPAVIDIGGRSVYIGHGDELCWNDWAYQFYKSLIRSSWMRLAADRLPASLRRSLARKMSQTSAAIVAGKSQETLRIPHRAYEQIVATGIDLIIHGHLHESYQRECRARGMQGTIVSFGWKDGKRNFIHFEG